MEEQHVQSSDGAALTPQKAEYELLTSSTSPPPPATPLLTINSSSGQGGESRRKDASAPQDRSGSRLNVSTPRARRLSASSYGTKSKNRLTGKPYDAWRVGGENEENEVPLWDQGLSFGARKRRTDAESLDYDTVENTLHDAR